MVKKKRCVQLVWLADKRITYMWAYKPHPSESFRSKTESVQGCTRPNSSGTRMSECDLQSLSSPLYPQIQVNTEPCNFKKEHINEMTKHYCVLWSQTWWTVIRHNIVWQINILFRNTVSSGIKSIQLVISITCLTCASLMLSDAYRGICL